MGKRTELQYDVRDEDGNALPVTLLIRCGKEGGGKGALWQVDKCSTLSTLTPPYLFEPIKKRAKDDISESDRMSESR